MADRLNYSCREAAEALGISERTLFTLTKAGEVPHLRLGNRVLYPVEQLQEWLRQKCSTDEPDRDGPRMVNNNRKEAA